jgi:hypothetical protein
LEAEPTRDLGVLAVCIDAEVSRMLGAVRSGADDDVVRWHGGISLPLPAFVGAAVGEFVFHGRDLALTIGQPWPIKREDALPVIDFFIAVAPHVVDAESSQGVAATFEIRFRGYKTATFVFEDGKPAIEDGRSRRADVRMSLDPISWAVLVPLSAPRRGFVSR